MGLGCVDIYVGESTVFSCPVHGELTPNNCLPDVKGLTTEYIRICFKVTNGKVHGTP